MNESEERKVLLVGFGFDILLLRDGAMEHVAPVSGPLKKFAFIHPRHSEICTGGFFWPCPSIYVCTVLQFFHVFFDVTEFL